MDPLCDEGEAYAAKMKAAGCEVQSIRVLGAPHTFAYLDGVLASGKLYNERTIAVLKEKLRE